MDKRKIFVHSSGADICAAGILLWRRNGDDLEFYVVQEQSKTRPNAHELNDPGGKAEHGDASPFDTAKREFFEETGIELVQSDLEGPIDVIHIPAAKYLLFLVKATGTCISLGGRGKWVNRRTLLISRGVRLGMVLNIIYPTCYYDDPHSQGPVGYDAVAARIRRHERTAFWMDGYV